MNPMNAIPSPQPLDAPPQQEQGATLESLGYTDSTERCGVCSHYDQEMSVCNLAGGAEVDPEGSCGSFEAGEAQSEAPAEEQAETVEEA